MSQYEVLIIGGGPSGLFCAWNLIKAGIRVLLADRMQSMGRKYLLAGATGGLNITHSGTPSELSEKYYGNETLFERLLSEFSPKDTESWYNELGTETFIGNSGKIFAKLPVKEVLAKWLATLETSPFFKFMPGYELTELPSTQVPTAVLSNGKEQIPIQAKAVVLALGGASHPETGSDGRWQEVLKEEGVSVTPLGPANCGFEVAWSDHLKEKIISKKEPLDIALAIDGRRTTGEVVLTGYGLEGSGVYSIGYYITQKLFSSGSCTLDLDLLPGLSVSQIAKRLQKPRGKNSLSNYLRKTLGVSGTKFLLLKESASAELLTDIQKHPELFKSLSVTITGSRPVEEAISSTGGIKFSELDDNMMLRSRPGIFIIGEMADWTAPTGGYLLQGCFSTAFCAAKGIMDFIS